MSGNAPGSIPLVARWELDGGGQQLRARWVHDCRSRFSAALERMGEIGVYECVTQDAACFHVWALFKRGHKAIIYDGMASCISAMACAQQLLTLFAAICGAAPVGVDGSASGRRLRPPTANRDVWQSWHIWHPLCGRCPPLACDSFCVYSHAPNFACLLRLAYHAVYIAIWCRRRQGYTHYIC